jgi:hypothetical protein
VRVKIDAIDSMLEDVQASKRSFEEITGMAPEQVTEGFAANAFSMPPETRQSGLPRVEAARQVLALRGRPAKWIIDTVPNAGQIEGLAAYLSQREEMEMLRAKTPQTDSTSQRIGELKPKVEAFEAQLEQMASYQKPLEAAQRFSTGVQ